MDYYNFWKNNSLNLITPRGLSNPEGFNVLRELGAFCRGIVLEVGCGTGRLSQAFEKDSYIGTDLSSKAIDVARKANPEYVYGLAKKRYPDADTTLFYTVCLHIPDSEILDVLSRCKSKHIVIAEIMNPQYRRETDAYNIANNRDQKTYEKLLSKIKYKLAEAKEFDYAYYKGEKITFLRFEKCNREN